MPSILRAAPPRPPITHTFTSPPSLPPGTTPTLSTFLSYWLYCACPAPSLPRNSYPPEPVPPNTPLDQLFSLLSRTEDYSRLAISYAGHIRNSLRDASITHNAELLRTTLPQLRSLLTQMAQDGQDPSTLLLNHYFPPTSSPTSTRTLTTSATFDEILSSLTQLQSQGSISEIGPTYIRFLLPACSFQDRRDTPPLTLGPWIATLTPIPPSPTSPPRPNYPWWSWLGISRAPNWLATTLPNFVVHPHINSNGGHCWGVAQQTLPPFIYDPNPAALFGVLCSWASTYNGQSPYQTLSSIRSLLFPSAPLSPTLLVPTVDPNHVAPSAPLPDQLPSQNPAPGVPHGPSSRLVAVDPSGHPSPGITSTITWSGGVVPTSPTTPPPLLRALPADAAAPPALLRPLPSDPIFPDSDHLDDSNDSDTYDEPSSVDFEPEEESEESEEVVSGSPLPSPPPSPGETTEEILRILSILDSVPHRNPVNAPNPPTAERRPRIIPNYQLLHDPSDIPF